MYLAEARPWSDLPPEILSMIGRRLDTRMDVLRFRSVCSSFRSSIPPLRRDASRSPFRIFCPQRPPAFLRASTVYALEKPEEGATAAAAAAPSGRARWLLKLEELELGHMRLLSLFSQRGIACLPGEFPKVLDSLQFRIVEICRQYTYSDRTGWLVQGIQKVVMHPDSVWSDLDQCSVYFIVEGGQLGYCKYGDENWSLLVDPHSQCSGYDDIVVYDGKVCVIDGSGSVSHIDSSFRLQSFSLPIQDRHHRGSGYWKHLVVSSGDLYAVDRFVRQGVYASDPEFMKTYDFRVYRLNHRCGRWEEVRSLGNSAFFLCKLCSFAVPAHELGGRDGNCIHYAEKADSFSSREDVNVFSLADRSIKCLGFSDSIWRLPT